jgi:hypothetical protein
MNSAAISTSITHLDPFGDSWSGFKLGSLKTLDLKNKNEPALVEACAEHYLLRNA